MDKNNCPPCRKNSVGGQAVIEGVMMKNGNKVALAMRKEDGSIEIANSEFHPLKEKHKWLNIPILRGVIGFVESMMLSFKTLGKSTDMLGLDELEEKEKQEKLAKKAKKKAEKEARKNGTAVKEENTDDVSIKSEESVEKSDVTADLSSDVENTEKTDEVSINSKKTDANEEENKEEKKKSSGSTVAIMAISLVLGLVLAVFLFVALPTLVTSWLDVAYRNIFDTAYGINHYVKAAIEGVIKVSIFIAYLALVSLMKDIKRTFAYHGAEHKSIACYEKGLELTPENARKCTRFHPRCGTSFLFVMLFIGIIAGMFIPDGPWRIPLKILTLPVVMGVGYEFIMLAGKHQNWFTKMLSAPGLWMQRLTTKEPDDYQLAVAICAIKATMPEEFPDFDPSEYKITREQNKGHIMYEEKKDAEEIQNEADKETTENSENTDNVSEN